MFKAPPEIGTELFARIPDQYRKSGQLSPERILAGKGNLKTDSYIEGPAFDQDGNLFISPVKNLGFYMCIKKCIQIISDGKDIFIASTYIDIFKSVLFLESFRIIQIPLHDGLHGLVFRQIPCRVISLPSPPA